MFKLPTENEVVSGEAEKILPAVEPEKTNTEAALCCFIISW